MRVSIAQPERRSQASQTLNPQCATSTYVIRALGRPLWYPTRALLQERAVHRLA